MSERFENFKGADDESEETLVAPRFDAEEARRAHPVVPFAEAPPRAAYAGARRPRHPRRSWTPALMAVMLLAAAAVGGAVATKLVRGPQASPAAAQPADQIVPAQTAEAPPAAAPPAARALADEPAKPARTRRARDAAGPAPVEVARDDEDDDEDRRDKDRQKRREREEEMEKEMRKALKRAKEKAPRLVGVLTGP